VLYYKLLVSKVLRYGPRVTRESHSFTCHPHTNYTCLYSPATGTPPFGWYSLCLPMKGWPGWVELGGWSHTEINVPHRELNPDTVTHLSTNRARRWLTWSIEANALTTTANHQPVNWWYVSHHWCTCRRLLPMLPTCRLVVDFTRRPPTSCWCRLTGSQRSFGGRSRSLAHVSGMVFPLTLRLLRRWLSSGDGWRQNVFAAATMLL